MECTRRPNNIKVSHPKISQKQSSNSLSRKSSSVRNYRGRKYIAQEELESKQKYFGSTKQNDGNRSGFVGTDNDGKKYGSNNTSVTNAINYYSKMSNIFPRSKTNSRKRGAVIFKGKDSRNKLPMTDVNIINGTKGNIKRTPVNYNSNITRVTGNHRSHLKERIKTIEYNDNSFSTIAARSNTVTRKRKIPQNNGEGVRLIKPYSNFAPSANTRSNITIDRRGSASYGKMKNQSTINSDAKRSTSKKIFMPSNEYNDDSIITVNSNSF